MRHDPYVVTHHKSCFEMFSNVILDLNYFNEDKSFCLGNNRLAVIDEKGGKQPMFSQDKKSLVVFNGAIYNFREIKQYLKNKGINFVTD